MHYYLYYDTNYNGRLYFTGEIWDCWHTCLIKAFTVYDLKIAEWYKNTLERSTQHKINIGEIEHPLY